MILRQVWYHNFLPKDHMRIIDREPTADIGISVNPLPGRIRPVFSEITKDFPVTSVPWAFEEAFKDEAAEVLDPTKNSEVTKGRSRFEVGLKLVYPTTSVVTYEKGRERSFKKYVRGSRGRRHRGCESCRRSTNRSSSCPHLGIPGLKLPLR